MIKIVTVLVEKGKIDVNSTNSGGETPLHLASM